MSLASSHSSDSPLPHWHTLSPEAVTEYLGSSLDGHTTKIVEAFRAQYGANILPRPKKKTRFQIFLSQFKSPLIILLCVVAGVTLVLKEYADTAIVSLVVLFNAIIGMIQEGRAEDALASLESFITTDALVFRDGIRVTVADKELVMGDRIILRPGDKIPADARIITSHQLVINEAVLTGESQAVSKHSEVLENPEALLGDRHNMLFQGTLVTSGSTEAIVVGVGKNTQMGLLSQEIKNNETEIPLAKNLRTLSMMIMFGAIIFGTLAFGIGVIQGRGFEEMIFVTLSLIVSVIPEGLPIVMTLILARGVQRMAHKKVLVKKLQAVDALGQADILAVDKTGTLTKNQMMVTHIITHELRYRVSGSGYRTDGTLLEEGSHALPSALFLERYGIHAILSANAEVFRADAGDDEALVTGDPTEAALLVVGQKMISDTQHVSTRHELVIDEPFSSEIQMSRRLYHDRQTDEWIVMVNGAPEKLFDASTHTLDAQGQEIPFDHNARQHMMQEMLGLAEQGLRIIATAQYRSTEKPENLDTVTSQMTLLGLFGMEDTLRPHIDEAVKTVTRAGIRMVMITGDYPVSALSIAKQAGIMTPGSSLVTGADIDRMNDEDLVGIVAHASVFARVTPRHKMRIIQAFQRRGHTIAMTGDGVNDVPSLVAADLGLAMGITGTAVTKDAADIILLDDRFENIAHAVAEGRAIYATIYKALTYLFSTNFGELLIILTALIIGMPLPLLAVQILWLNLVTDGFLPLAYSEEKHDPHILKERFVKPPKYLLDQKAVGRLFGTALLMTIGTLGMFSLYFEQDYVFATTLALITVSAFQWFNVWNCRHPSRSLFSMKLFDNPYLIGATGLVIVMQLFAVYAPIMNTLLGTTPLHPRYWFYAIAIAFSVVVKEEIRKYFVRKKMSRKKSPCISIDFLR
jgi:P-type Ca2+ transporter type 2C